MTKIIHIYITSSVNALEFIIPYSCVILECDYTTAYFFVIYGYQCPLVQRELLQYFCVSLEHSLVRGKSTTSLQH